MVKTRGWKQLFTRFFGKKSFKKHEVVWIKMMNKTLDPRHLVTEHLRIWTLKIRIWTQIAVPKEVLGLLLKKMIPTPDSECMVLPTLHPQVSKSSQVMSSRQTSTLSVWVRVAQNDIFCMGTCLCRRIQLRFGPCSLNHFTPVKKYVPYLLIKG